MEFHLNYFRSWKMILLKCCTQYVSVWKTQQCPQDWKNSVSIPVIKKGDVKECSSYHMIVLISHASKVMLKILQAMLQQYVSWEFPDVQAAFRKCRGIGDQIAKFIGSQRNHRNSRKISILASLTILKSLTVWITTNCGQFFKRREYLTTLPISWETCIQVKKQVKSRHGTTDWFKIEKGVWQVWILSPCLLNLYAEYIMWNERLDELQAEINTTGRNINNLRYAGDSILMAESE